jgi:ribosome maturation factor RimP
VGVRYTEVVEQSQCAQAHFFIGRKVLNREAIIKKVAEITDRVGLEKGIEAVEVELAGSGRARVLRIFIDKPEGVTHTDCEYISHQVGTIVDVEDVIPGGSYHLEVSSPGVERKLSKPADFQRFLGQKAKVVLREPVENQKAWIGTLTAFENNVVTMEPSAGKSIQFGLDLVQRANLKFEW